MVGERGSAWMARASRLGPLARRAAGGEAAAMFRRLPVNPGVVLYESFAGNGMLCNPEAIFRSLLVDPRHPGMRHVWALDDPGRHPRVVEEFAGDERISLVRRRSARYFRHLATAGLLVNNATFPAGFGKRPGQIYLNTWHGSPIKTMGYDIPGGGPATANIVRNFLQADYLVSAGRFMTEKLYAGAYRLRNVFSGQIIEAGQPRVDRQFLPHRDARAILMAGRPRSGGRVVLYAPTWRGSSFAEPDDESALLAARTRRLSEYLGPGWDVRLKVHQSVYGAARLRADLAGALVDNDIPTNVVLAGCDALIADYSSLVVDYLVLDRPVVFFVPDLDDFDEARGLYVEPCRWPGPVHSDLLDAARSVRESIADGAASYAHVRREWRDRMCPMDDGEASARVIDAALHGRTDHVARIPSDGRSKVLLYVGGLRSNGITASALNLLRQIDHTRYDVSVMFPAGGGADQAANIQRIDPRVRMLPRVGRIGGLSGTQLLRQLVQRRGVGARTRVLPLGTMFQAEWARCFGGATFDAIVDFMGYAVFWDLLLLQGPADHHAIWLHNDMCADAQRVVDGRRPLRRQLRAVFSTYRFFDDLVSVSPALRDINRSRLAAYAPTEAFTYALNVIDVEAILAGVQVPRTPSSGMVTFVAVGRLSSSKNFARLIKAYALLRHDHPSTRVLILGEGPERKNLEALINRLGVADGVILAGHQVTPYSTMADADCFVMTSDHEGQPMAILEALVLGLPVITTRFASVDSALPQGCGLVVDSTVTGVRDGMAAFLRGEIVVRSFDAEAYNAEAIGQFYAAIGLTAEPVR